MSLLRSIFSGCRALRPLLSGASSFHTSSVRADLSEFLDDKKNWSQNEVKHGRSWRLDELRIKSASDLHKLWFILLKERNMLLTMEEEAKRLWVHMPSPERLDKVEESMKNLETVVKERNKAYFELETGDPRERDEKPVMTVLGVEMPERPSEHLIPKIENKKWREERRHSFPTYVRKFQRKMNEKESMEKKRAHNRDRNHIIKLMKRFPHTDLNLLKRLYPEVDIDALVRKDKITPNWPPEETDPK